MRLVHHDAADAQRGELVDEAWTGEPLGRQEQQPVLAVAGALDSLALHRRLDGRVDECGGHSAICQAVDLVLHQGDERRDHQRQTAIDDRRYPVADALSGAGRCDGKDIAAREHRGHHIGLSRPEGVEPEDLPKRSLGPVDHSARV